MRAPLCSEACPNEQGLDSESEIQDCEKFRYAKAAVFGIHIDNLMGTAPRVVPQIPFILTRICQYIEEHGLHCKHLFLEGDEESIVESLRVDFIESGDAPLEATGKVASAAKLLIIFFEELPEPLIPVCAQPDFIQGMERLSLNTVDCVSHLKSSLKKLPDSVYQILKYLSRFLLQVASQQDYNGMCSDSLSKIFGPLIFRINYKDVATASCVQTIVNYFVQNYHAIFEDGPVEDTISRSCDESRHCQLPCPSTVVPVMTLAPLSVVIPQVPCDNSADINIPILLIEKPSDYCVKLSEEKHADNINRKRKERRLSGESDSPHPCSEDAQNVEVGSNQEARNESKHATESPPTFLAKEDILENDEMALNEKNHSPHPPNAKRREVEVHSAQSSFSFMPLPWTSASQFESSITEKSDKKQNSVAESEVSTTMDCDAFGNLDLETDTETVTHDRKESEDSQKGRIPRSASCPVPSTDNSHLSEEETSSLSLSWSLLFESEDSEPVRSEHRYSWPLTKEAQEEATLLSPTVQSLRKTNYHEAPLSPSAYRSYLSHRGHHLDPSVPPSPPVEQEDFAANIEEASAIANSIKHLTKKIHCIKKKIRKYDEKFEQENGYKPSHSDKTNHPEAKKLVNDLHKARKELKALKEESHLEQVSPASWHPSKCSHILGDSTNQVDSKQTKPTVQESFGSTMKCLADERRLANRPEDFQEMTSQQMRDEKVAIQKMLLQFESVHGKPTSKEERSTIRPLYDRYRNVKRLLVRSGSFPSGSSKKDLCSDLQPILEHETLDLRSPQHASLPLKTEQVEPSDSQSKESTEQPPKPDLQLNEIKSLSTSIMSVQCDNSNVHELPLSEMIFQMQQVKSQKRHLRKILREFESEFYRLNGRKVQKEDKAPVDSLYGEYKHVKARLKLLEALVSKHDQHQLM